MTMEKKHSVLGFFSKRHSPQPAQAPVQQAPVETQPGLPSEEVLETTYQGPEFAEKDVAFSSLFMPFVKNYVSNLSHNRSPNKLPYPPCFYYPASSLMHQMNLQMHYIDLLIQANTLATPLERFLSVLKYSVSTCSLTKFPYKPIIAFIGETAQSYHACTDGNGTDTTYYIGEQVDREPPTSAFYIANPTKGVVHEGSVAMIPKFKQAHVHVRFVGQRRTILAHPQGLWNETYIADVPDLMIRLLRMHTELGGSINLNCPSTGFAASIQFKDKPIFGGLKNVLTGTVTLHGREIYTIDGAWDSVVYLNDVTTRGRFELFNRNTCRKQKAQTYPLEQQPETSGDKVWGPLLETLVRGDFEQAKVIKTELDEQGHERLARIEQAGGFVASFFHKNPATGGWEINNPSIIYAQGGQPTM